MSADPSPPTPPADPIDRHRLWLYALGAAALSSVLSTVLGLIAARFGGPPPSLPLPPVIVVQPSGGPPPTVTVHPASR